MKQTKSMSAAKAFIIVFGLSFMYGSTVFLNPAMQLLIEAFPNETTASVRMISTLSSIFGVIVSLGLTSIFGARLKHKPVAIAGALLTIIGGTGPFFFGNTTLTGMYAWRVIYGVGIGCVTVKNATIRRLFTDLTESAKYLGISMAVVNVTAFVGQIISGFLADMDWKYCFLLNALGVIPLIINTLVLQEPEVEASAAESKQPRSKLDPRVFLYMAMMVISTLWLNPVLSGTATLISERSLGTAAISGTVVSMYTLGNAITSSFFGTIYKKLQKFGYPICTVGVVIGLALMVFGQNIFVIGLGVFCCGAFSNIKRCFLMQWAGDVCEGAAKTFASTMLMTGLSFGSFLSVYWITISNILCNGLTMFQTEITRSYALGCVLFAITSVIFFVKAPNPKEIDV